jgi:superfamily II DNA or RNA helicase
MTPPKPPLQPKNELPEHDPEVGQLVELRSRRWLVEEVQPGDKPGHSSVVHLACAEDDAQGEEVEVFWNYEIDRRILKQEGWADLAAKGFDTPRRFAAFLHTLRWNCVTATDPDLFQAPFRAGIKLDAYQMEPLRKALRMPRVNLFIADDTGLGKTIEAGLIARELLLRKKVKTIVVSAPSSVLEQWQAEMEERFGLLFEILDRAYFTRMRRERGFGVNPWATHSRFLVSHSLLRDPTYAEPMRAWLGPILRGSLLILDEAHHAAPSSGGRYGIESKFTKAIRDLSHRFEHRLFLSATPHNGHSNSFSTLLELLDPHRFTRGVTASPKSLEAVMVRRLKEDIRAVQGGFPKRSVVPIRIEGLPEDTPELELSRLLDEYRRARQERFQSATNRAQAAAGLLVVGLQQRLLSSIEAFAFSLKNHRKTVRKQRARELEQLSAEAALASAEAEVRLFTSASEAAGGGVGEDETEEWTLDEAEQAEERQIETITTATEAAAAVQAHDAVAKAANEALWRREVELLDRMEQIADRARGRPDAKMHRLLDWIREHLCPGLPPLGMAPPPGSSPPRWNNRRLLIFTENRVGTKRYLRTMLEAAIARTDRAEERIVTIDGLTRGATRREIQRRFNADPKDDPLRILLATDAAREGLNFQAHCTDLFHWDLPWNPGRIEQRNGRIDRKLQPEPAVQCHYFVLPQRAEDRVLDVLVKKTETIRTELGSLSKVIDDRIERRLTRGGIPHGKIDQLAAEIAQADLKAERKRAAAEELDAARERRDELRAQIERCQNLLQQSRDWVQFETAPFRDAISCSLELMGAKPLQRIQDEDGKTVWTFPSLDGRTAADPSWVRTLDSLRRPQRRDQKLAAWRKAEAPRPVVFEDEGVLTDETVHLHLEQRVAQRLLARFRSQGFLHHDLSRACLAQAADSIPRVILLGRLSLYGHGAERLHEEVITVAARWSEPARRTASLRAYAREAEARTLDLLEASLARAARQPIDNVVEHRLLDAAARDIEELRPQLEPRARELAEVATRKLHERGEQEARDLHRTLEQQRERVQRELAKRDAELTQRTLSFNQEEERQLQADMRSWKERLGQFDRDLKEEPKRARDFYEVRVAPPVEPLGIVYLWPETN